MNKTRKYTCTLTSFGRGMVPWIWTGKKRHSKREREREREREKERERGCLSSRVPCNLGCTLRIVPRTRRRYRVERKVRSARASRADFSITILLNTERIIERVENCFRVARFGRAWYFISRELLSSIPRGLRACLRPQLGLRSHIRETHGVPPQESSCTMLLQRIWFRRFGRLESALLDPFALTSVCCRIVRGSFRVKGQPRGGVPLRN